MYVHGVGDLLNKRRILSETAAQSKTSAHTRSPCAPCYDMLEFLLNKEAFVMGLGRLLTIVILIWLGYLLYKRLIAPTRKNKKSHSKSIENTVRCAYCQLHIPEQEAVSRAGRHYCSQQHLELDKHDQA
jgi:uncharacterized protein